jgi:hypothetical protein
MAHLDPMKKVASVDWQYLSQSVVSDWSPQRKQGKLPAALACAAGSNPTRLFGIEFADTLK